MSDIRELNEQRIRLGERARLLGMVNQANEPERRLAQDAQYRLVNDAWMKAESDYQRAIAGLSPAELEALARPSRE